MTQRVLLLIAALFFGLASASPQVVRVDGQGRLSPEQYGQVSKNTAQMQVTVTLDRTEYFPGEDSVLSISVKNPTSYPLEIWEPFVRETGFLMIQRKDPKAPPLWDGWVDVMPREEASPGANGPTQFLAPGQEIRRQWLLSASSRDPLAGLNRLPALAGDYRLVYYYAVRGVASFRVVYPTLEDSYRVVLQKRGELRLIDPDGKERLPPKVITRQVPILLLGYEGQHVLAVGRRTTEPVTQYLKPGDLLTYDVVTAYFRLVETSSSIKLIDGSADAAENIVITYADDRGQSHRIKLDPNRNVVP